MQREGHSLNTTRILRITAAALAALPSAAYAHSFPPAWVFVLVFSPVILNLVALLMVLTLARRHRFLLTMANLGGVLLSTAIFGVPIGLYGWSGMGDFSEQWVSLLLAIGVILVVLFTRRKTPATRKSSET